MSFNPLSAIHKEHKLEGHNYIVWKQNLDIVLSAEEYKYVLTTECPPEPAANASAAVKETYRKWCKANEMAKCYMLASMSKYFNISIKNRAAKSLAFRSIMTKVMKEGTSSLPASYQQFKLNFGMNKRAYTLAELLTELQSAEDLMV
ncbi:uncharacterized protein LOC121745951 [Salvia splendens]|uniref:uncharacterized protein LOC121745951 n=1 Tax=Salvia splendens TaxID=180675 RepID=UPI001C27FCD2|nr:uncharacterized protein LOC121745951 [Salvia splendens]